MFKTHLHMFIDVWKFPHQYKKEAVTKLTIKIRSQINDRKSTATSSGEFAGSQAWTKTPGAWEKYQLQKYL